MPLFFLIAPFLHLTQDGETTHSRPLPEPTIAKPPVGRRWKDPRFGASLVRISDARKLGFKGVAPEYSRRQAWNADESLLLLRTGEGKALLYDGTSYRFKKELEGVSGEDVFWHQKDPRLLLFNPDRTLYALDVVAGTRKKLFAFPEYTFANTRGEGNLSRDGRLYGFVGQNYDARTSTVSYKDLVVFDLAQGRVLAKHPLPAKLGGFDWVSISPSGKYLVVDYATTGRGRYQGLEVYDRQLRFLWQKPLGAGHSDLAIDVDGEDVLVMDVYDAQKNVNRLKKFRISDGKETVLLEYSWAFDVHISCRNERQRGWCFISTFDYVGRLTHDAATWLPFEDEVFALKMDGSRAARRLAHHRSRRFSPQTPDSDRSVYLAEPHATVSRKGNRILFGSNWGERIAEEASVDAYVIDTRK